MQDRTYCMRLVENHIPCFIGRHQPATAMFLGKLSRILGQQPRGHHVVVEGVAGFFVCHAGLFGFLGEVVFDFEANGVA